jgi:hypothetical protein
MLLRRLRNVTAASSRIHHTAFRWRNHARLRRAFVIVGVIRGPMPGP